MMEGTLNNIAINYSSYLQMSTKEKLHSGSILENCAKEILQINKAELENSLAIQRNYLIHKIAGDLLRQAKDMGMTKQYDCSPKIKEYIYLAFNLAFESCCSKANKILIPFLINVIYYERNKKDKSFFEKLNQLLKESIELEKIYLESVKI